MNATVDTKGFERVSSQISNRYWVRGNCHVYPNPTGNGWVRAYVYNGTADSHRTFPTFEKAVASA